MTSSGGVGARKLFLILWIPSLVVLAAALVESVWLSAGNISIVGVLAQAAVLVALAVAGLVMLSILPRTPEADR